MKFHACHHSTWHTTQAFTHAHPFPNGSDTVAFSPGCRIGLEGQGQSGSPCADLFAAPLIGLDQVAARASVGTSVGTEPVKINFMIGYIASDLRIQWWRRRESNSQPPPCKGGALPIELRPLIPPRDPLVGRSGSRRGGGLAGGFVPERSLGSSGIPTALDDGENRSARGGQKQQLLHGATSSRAAKPSRPQEPAVNRRTGSHVGLGGLEPPTSSLSGKRSNRLSYRPATSLTAPTGANRMAPQLGKRTPRHRSPKKALPAHYVSRVDSWTQRQEGTRWASTLAHRGPHPHRRARGRLRQL